MKPEDSRAILVLGMHRSGTSAMAGALNALGVPMGAALTPADPEINAKGYWEHSAVNDINERILRALGYSWLDERELPTGWPRSETIASLKTELVEALKREFGSHRLWAVKDPRLCRLLPLWLEVLEEIGCTPVFVVMTRDPIEVAESLWKRNGIQEWKAALLWLRYAIDAEVGSRGWPRVCVEYDDLLSEWRTLLPLIARELLLDWPTPFANTEPTLSEFLDSSLRHAVGTFGVVTSSVEMSLAERAYKALRVSIDLFSEMQSDLIIQLDQAVSRHQPALAHVNQCLLTIEKLSVLKIVVAAHEREIARIKSTVSWRLTKPIRFLANLSKKSLEGR